MPCRTYEDEHTDETRELSELQSEVKILRETNTEIEARLCALVSELALLNKNTFNLDTLLKNASVNGQIDLVMWWQTHKREDTERLRDKLSTFQHTNS